MKEQFGIVPSDSHEAWIRKLKAKGIEIEGKDISRTQIINIVGELVEPKAGSHPVFVIDMFKELCPLAKVKADNPELLKAKSYNLKAITYPEALGEITKQYYTIAVSGAHGKSTTTAMLGLVLAKAGLDPTVIVGTKVKEFGDSNFRAGKSKFLVIEACEYDDSFLNYSPKIIVVTNIDKEHLDYFKNFANVKKAFKNFIAKLPKDGFLVNKENKKDFPKLKKILKVPGEHNIKNASMALQVARILGIADKITFKALSEFKGTWRRFEIKRGNANGKNLRKDQEFLAESVRESLKSVP